MTLLNWFDVVVVGALVVGLLAQFGMKWRQSPEELGYALLKQRAAALGVDVTRIPDPAWYAIVEMSIASRDRSSLAGALEEEAMEIKKFVQGSPCNRHSVAPHILTEYRV